MDVLLIVFKFYSYWSAYYNYYVLLNPSLDGLEAMFLFET